MVSIKTLGTLGIIAVGAALFVAAGGAKGLGSKIGSAVGGGFSDFSQAIGGAFTSSLFGGSANADVPVVNGSNDTGTIGPAPRTGTEAFDPFGNLEGNFKGLQNILDSINNFFTGKSFVNIGGSVFQTVSGGAKNAPIVDLGGGARGSEFGGFIDQSTQNAALLSAIAESKSKFPEFF